LAYHFLFRYARETNRDIRGITPEAIDRLQQYDWPGNVRQLQNCIQAAVCQMAGRTILPTDLEIQTPASPVTIASAPLPSAEPASASALDLASTIEAMLRDGGKEVYSRVLSLIERELLTRALRFTHGRQAQASELLGINRATLRYKMRELGVSLDRVVSERNEPTEE
jgi:two-component system nitrogen regulation response regulator GlnG